MAHSIPGPKHEPPYDLLYGAGFNALNQLKQPTTTDASTSNDIVRFEALPTSANRRVEMLFAGWSSTHILATNTVAQQIQHIGRGYLTAGEWQNVPSLGLHSGFGDHDGLIGCLDSGGRLFVMPKNDGASSLLRRHGTLVCQSHANSPLLAHVALAGNGRIAATFKQAPNAGLSHVLEFRDFEKFLAYYSDPTGELNYPDQHYMLAGRPKKLLANIATFTLLMDSGVVWTWGDPRHQSLGRSISSSASEGQGSSGAGNPGLVKYLEGVKITKIASGGWMTVAISEEHSAYIWGSCMPGTEQVFHLKDLQPGGISMVELPGEETDGPYDILDAALGEGHVVLVVEGGKVFGIGSNSNGQLAQNSQGSFANDWAGVPAPGNVQAVYCSPKATFLQCVHK